MFLQSGDPGGCCDAVAPEEEVGADVMEPMDVEEVVKGAGEDLEMVEITEEVEMEGVVEGCCVAPEVEGVPENRK